MLGYMLLVVLTLEAPGALGARRAGKSSRVQASPNQGVGQQLLALRHLVHQSLVRQIGRCFHGCPVRCCAVLPC
jgi:hypothetical protein